MNRVGRAAVQLTAVLVTLAGTAVVAGPAHARTGNGAADLPATAPAATPATKVGGRHATKPAAPRQYGEPPVFNNYLVCFNGWVYADYTDPDGHDENLNVWVWIYTDNWATSHGFWLTNTGPSVHGVFFYLELASTGINPAAIDGYAFIGFDETQTWSAEWTWADRSCKLL